MRFWRISFHTLCLAILLSHSSICAKSLDGEEDMIIHVKPVNNDQGRLNPQSNEQVPIKAYYNSHRPYRLDLHIILEK